ncbi:DUF1810 domain-containing protein [Janthinobacterium sp.]|uniref:DUF1810 domain-containing protein n=1 Tax=Janthinobacterium sp. TaxID=1871054 RepID=UPI002897EE53|nr:DUF1810 domain-containing protein [Janthinobacterium sp.]
MAQQFDLQRFVDAQDTVYDTVRAELRAGHKRSHWMWYIFPQLAGLGRSETARHYALSGVEEAQAYLAHPLLGQRLEECCTILTGIEGRTASAIFGYPDDLKLHSSLTLFAQAAPDQPLFGACLAKYFNGQRDAATLQLL